MDRDYDQTEHERVSNAIHWVCDDIAELLISKNKQYGNSALNPVRIFARGLDRTAQMNVRLDDKLSRIQLGDPDTEDEDVERDILGYLVLKAVAVLMDEGNEGILNGTAQIHGAVSARLRENQRILETAINGVPGCEGFDGTPESAAGFAAQLIGRLARLYKENPMHYIEDEHDKSAPVPKGSDAAYAEAEPGPGGRG